VPPKGLFGQKHRGPAVRIRHKGCGILPRIMPFLPLSGAPCAANAPLTIEVAAVSAASSCVGSKSDWQSRNPVRAEISPVNRDNVRFFWVEISGM
jgi:hypothetical protein